MNDPQRFSGSSEQLKRLSERKRSLRSVERAAEREADELQPIPRHQNGDRFIRGPIPYEWLRLAQTLDGKAANLAWAIWWLAGMKHSNPIKLTRHVLHDFSISPRTVRRLLTKFESVGLVKVDRHRGRSPYVVLLDPEIQQTACKENGRAELPMIIAEVDE